MGAKGSEVQKISTDFNVEVKFIRKVLGMGNLQMGMFVVEY